MNITSHYPLVDPENPPDITTLVACYDELRNDAARLHAMHEQAWIIGEAVKLTSPDAERVIVETPDGAA